MLKIILWVLLELVSENIFPILGCAAFIFVAIWAINSNADKMMEWPKELENNKSGYCTLTNYQSCKENQWFGIYHSELPLLESLRGNEAWSSSILNEICLDWGGDSSSSFFRFIKMDDDNLYLCRMKDPDDVDRGEILAEAEHTPYWNKLR